MLKRELHGETDCSFRRSGCSGSFAHRREGWRETRPYAIPSTTGGVFLHPWSHPEAQRQAHADQAAYDAWVCAQAPALEDLPW